MTERKGKVLMICALFPPSLEVGAIRPDKFAKYLPEFGWEPTVLTTGSSGAIRGWSGKEGQPGGPKVVRARFPDLFRFSQRLLGLDPLKDNEQQLLEREPHPESGLKSLRSRIIRAISNFSKNWIAFPDAYITWLIPALYSGWKEIRGNGYDAIYSTSPPATDHVVAFLLKSLTGLPWVADYRDPWSQDEFLDRSPRRRKLEGILEKSIIKKADFIVAISVPVLEMLLRLHGLKETRGAVIPNGFDPDEYDLEHEPIKDRFVITYTGHMYGLRRDPRPLLSAITRLIDDGVIESEEVLVRFYAPWEPRLERLRDELEHEGIMEVHEPVSHTEALRRQVESTALLHLMLDDPLDQVVHGAKVFEYLGANKPILVWAPRGGIMEGFISETGAGEIATNEVELKSILRGWFEEFKESGTVKCPRNESEIAKYSRKHQSKELAEIMSNITS